MAVKVLELHHHGIRIGPSETDVKQALAFYHDVLGLDPDPGRPHIPTIDGYWMDVGGTAQIHLMGVEPAECHPLAENPLKRCRVIPGKFISNRVDLSSQSLLYGQTVTRSKLDHRVAGVRKAVPVKVHQASTHLVVTAE